MKLRSVRFGLKLHRKATSATRFTILDCFADMPIKLGMMDTKGL